MKRSRDPSHARSHGLDVGSSLHGSVRAQASHDSKPTNQGAQMPRYIVERSFPSGLEILIRDGGAQVCRTVVQRNAELGLIWRQNGWIRISISGVTNAGSSPVAPVEAPVYSDPWICAVHRISAAWCVPPPRRWVAHAVDSSEISQRCAPRPARTGTRSRMCRGARGAA